MNDVTDPRPDAALLRPEETQELLIGTGRWMF
jgi:hypothetical protein